MIKQLILLTLLNTYVYADVVKANYVVKTDEQLYRESFFLNNKKLFGFEVLHLSRARNSNISLCWQDTRIDKNILLVNIEYCKTIFINDARSVDRQLQRRMPSLPKKVQDNVFPILRSMIYQMGWTGFWNSLAGDYTIFLYRQYKFINVPINYINDYAVAIQSSYSKKVFNSVNRNEKWINQNINGWKRRRAAEAAMMSSRLIINLS